MKRILISTTALTAALASVLLLAPGRAQASTAKETFRSMRSALARAAQSGELTVSGSMAANGAASFSVLLDGQPLPPDVPVHVKGDDHGDYTDYTITVDLSDSNFSSISYGKDHNTLKLVPKASPGNVDVIKLDPKSRQPEQWTLFKKVNGSMKQTSNLSYIVPDGVVGPPPAAGKLYSPVPDRAAKHSDPVIVPDDPITVHIRMGKGGGTATLSVKQN